MKYLVIILTMMILAVGCGNDGRTFRKSPEHSMKIRSGGKVTYFDEKGDVIREENDPNYVAEYTGDPNDYKASIGYHQTLKKINLSDVDTARKHLISLPDECGKSNMSTLSDGTIRIEHICNGVNKGTIYIKNGRVTGMD